MTNLLRLPELLQYLKRHVEVVQQVVAHGEPYPRRPLCRPQLEQLIPRLLIPVQIPHLQQGKLVLKMTSDRAVTGGQPESAEETDL